MPNSTLTPEKINLSTLNTTWEQRIDNEKKLRRNDHRSVFQRDRARILHSAAFRRLQAKTQVLGAGLNDFYRTRLTHSLEASQLGTGIVAQLKIRQPEFKDLFPSTSLMESLCLAHDIGHPPFGHGGEVALNYMMRDHGGFEGNAQTLRIVSKLEPYTLDYGMNLARRTLLGLLKYPVFISQTQAEQRALDVTNYRHLKAKDWHPAKGVYQQDSDILSLKRDENVTIPIEFDFSQLSSLSNELKEKLILTKPRNIGQALRIEGMSPAAVNLILSMIKSKAKNKKIA